jgi:release factor glutamine methyltransferase
VEIMHTDHFQQLVSDLRPYYGEGEARSIVRIVWEDVFTQRAPFDKPLSEAERERWADIRVRLLRYEPVQYIVGAADFFGLRYRVSPAVLIPRQETEELVAWVLDWLRKAGLSKPKVLDVGVGSGCIGITIVRKNHAVQLLGLEKSSAALAVARDNARRLLPVATVQWIEGDALAADTWTNLQDLDVIVSNPPYIPYNETDKVPPHVRAFEPDMALFVEDFDPLIFYQIIANQALKCLKTDGALFFECNQYNAPELVRWLKANGWNEVQLRQDLSGNDRMILAKK